MPKLYSIKYDKFYAKLSRITGLSNEEIDVIFLKIVSIIKNDLNRTGSIYVPYLGTFTLTRMPPRKREMLDFASKERFMVDVPAEDKLKFTINRDFRKLFR